jgi:2,4-dienoyl-CoA reductase-like NADH-dependent reductase (Old Yellow Enzyme family)
VSVLVRQGKDDRLALCPPRRHGRPRARRDRRRSLVRPFALALSRPSVAHRASYRFDSSVVPEGCICPEDLGLWSDDQIAPAKRAVGFVLGVQLGHAGRKASTAAPWVATSTERSGRVVPEEHGGWPDNVWAPSAIRFAEAYAEPKEATEAYLADLIQSYVDAVDRAKRIGFDFIEIHGAHGYLLHSFCSPISNKRTDRYGGSLENRTRFPLEVTRAVRAAWGDDRPLFYRVSASDWAEGGEKGEDGQYLSWGIEQSIYLAKELQVCTTQARSSKSGLLTSRLLRSAPAESRRRLDRHLERRRDDRAKDPRRPGLPASVSLAPPSQRRRD